MSIYSLAESGTHQFRSRFTKSISNRMRYDCRFHELIPVLKRFCLPGDVWRINGQALVRFLPMYTPSMTPYELIARYFFVPLRQIESDTELIITGSNNGQVYNGTLPTFKNFVQDGNKSLYPNCYKVQKYSFWDYMNVQCGDYENIKTADFLPAAYWEKGYYKIRYDYYDDENYSAIHHQNYPNFESFWNVKKTSGADASVFTSSLKKDYFTSVLPWQLKSANGVAPLLDVQGNASITGFSFGEIESFNEDSIHWANNRLIQVGPGSAGSNDLNRDSAVGTETPFRAAGGSNVSEDISKVENFTQRMQNAFNGQNVNINGLGFTADELRVMMAQTRIFERLARTGSRYTEYLYANFGTAPADETLQRPKYLGGWKIPIVVTEVLQTAEDGSTPVGTMRGHGISRGGNSIKDFYCKEFGLLFGLVEVRPKIEYTTGIPRQLTYKKRFDFFNPSFQHLSEQETRNGELYVNFTPDSDGNYDNDNTFGFQAYANELRSSQDEVVGDMRDGLKMWGSQLSFTSRPNAQGLITATNHYGSFNNPFVASGVNARNIIVDFYNILDVYRPMVRYATPGLVDHF